MMMSLVCTTAFASEAATADVATNLTSRLNTPDPSKQYDLGFSGSVNLIIENFLSDHTRLSEYN